MSSLKIKSISSLHAELSVPGDKSISHRVAMIAGLSNGSCEIRNFLPSEDCLNTLGAMRALGVTYDVMEEMVGFGPTALRIDGQMGQLIAPRGPIDCGNSGTGMRLLAGLLAGQDFTSELTGDASLSGRPMGRIIKPLSEMGARIEALGAREGCAPLRISGSKLQPISYAMPMASAQVKSAVLLAGLFAEGKTTVIQPAVTRDHTERMLNAFNVRVVTEGNEVSTWGGQVPEARDFLVPGDISSAAFWIVAAAALPGSLLQVRNVGLNPTRTAILNVLMRMGAHISDSVQTRDAGEPIGHIEVRGQKLHGTEILIDEVPNLIDEVPVLAVAGALAGGRMVIRNAAELRVKETDRIAVVAKNLRLMGATVTEFDDGMEIEGGAKLHGATLESHGDHRIAMAFAIAGLFARGETTIHDTDCVNTSYPGFAQHLDAVLHGRSAASDYQLATMSRP
jgi:3-phosphoshikimate 1-carboxyvinyltransferase